MGRECVGEFGLVKFSFLLSSFCSVMKENNQWCERGLLLRYMEPTIMQCDFFFFFFFLGGGAVHILWWGLLSIYAGNIYSLIFRLDLLSCFLRVSWEFLGVSFSCQYWTSEVKKTIIALKQITLILPNLSSPIDSICVLIVKKKVSELIPYK